jgi:cation diffusion facilitator family transporter
VADKRSSRTKDASHPLGYGREAYFWSLFAALGLFTIGAVVSVYNGIQELIDPEPATNFAVAYVVLAVSFVLEGISLTQSLRQAKRRTDELHTPLVKFIFNGSNPTLRAVIFEDSAALIGLLLAVAGIGLHQLTGNAVYDAIGSILIGVLLAGVAVLLIDRNRRFLIGAEPPSRYRNQAIRTLLASPSIDRVTYLHLEFVGPEKLYLVAAVDLVGNSVEDDVARALRAIEQKIETTALIDTAILTLSVSDEPSISF